MAVTKPHAESAKTIADPSPLSPCACFNARSAARAITDLYDHTLEPAGLRITQFAILTAIDVRGHSNMHRLAADLGLDASTLTRTLSPLETSGWVVSASGRDRRARRLELSKAGRGKLKQCRRLWTTAQRKLEDTIGSERFQRMIGDLGIVTRELRDETT